MSQWQRYTLEEIGDWGSGGTPLSSKAEYYNGDIPWLIIEDLNDGLVTKSLKTITLKGLANSSAKLLEPGTLLIAMYGSIGKLGITGFKCATNQAIAFCKINSDIAFIKYVFYYLGFVRPKLTDEGRGGTQQNISQTILKDFPIPLPTLERQKEIAHQLERADRLRRLRSYALEVSDRYLQGVFLELFGDPSSNARGWDVLELEDLLDRIESGSSPVCGDQRESSDEWAVLKLSAVTYGRFNADENKAVLPETKIKIGLEVKAGDLLFTRKN